MELSEDLAAVLRMLESRLLLVSKLEALLADIYSADLLTAENSDLIEDLLDESGYWSMKKSSIS